MATNVYQVRYGDDVDNTFIVLHPGDEEAVKRHFVENAAHVGYVFMTDGEGNLASHVHVKRIDMVVTGLKMRMARVHDARTIK